MHAKELLESGDLDGAMSELQDAVRNDAANASLRIFLFQLLCVVGDWKRAITQLKLSAEMDPLAVPMAQTYREAIICEVYREKVFAGEKDPLVFGEPQEWIAMLIEALRTGDDATRARAFDAAPESSGVINDMPFAWIADADMRLGPVLEIIINGRYFWMPFDALAEVVCAAPCDLRDTVWMPAEIKLRNGGDLVALIPTRYVSAADQSSAAEKLARVTNWTDAGGGVYYGAGQRLFATDTGDTGLLDLRKLEMGTG